MKLLPLVAIAAGLLALSSDGARASSSSAPAGTKPKPKPPSDQDLINAAVVATQTEPLPPQPSTTTKPPSSSSKPPSSSSTAAPVRPPQASPPPASQTASAPPTGPNPLPAGYNPAKARASAKQVAAHLAAKGRSGYSRDLLKAWQQAAALAPDGIYGGAARGALIHYGVKDPPRPFFKPTNTVPYQPPEAR